MATTTPNLGLSLPASSDNVSRTRYNTNMTLIDTAFGGGTDISSQITAIRTGDTIVCASAYQIGKIVIFGIRITLGSAASGAVQLISGLPIPVSAGANAQWAVASSMAGNGFYIRYQDGNISMPNGSASIASGSSIMLSGVYLAA